MGTTSGILTGSTLTEYYINYDVAKGSAFGIHFKHYLFGRSGSIAPIGFYRTLSLYTTITNTYESKDSNVKKFQNDFIYPAATIGFGRQTMLAKNLLLKTGIEIGWAFVPTNFLSETEDVWNPQEYAGYNLHGSLAGYYLFSLNFALGYTF
jgi:hypothetical protein